MKKSNNKSKIINILLMIVIIAAGVLVLVYPGESLITAVRILGIAMIIYGAIVCVSFILGARNWVLFITGLIALAAGIYANVRPDVIVAYFPLAAGLMLVISGIRDLFKAFALRSRTLNLWKVALIFAAITLLLGIVIIYNPFAVQATMVTVMGIGLIYNGVTGLLLALK